MYWIEQQAQCLYTCSLPHQLNPNSSFESAAPSWTQTLLKQHLLVESTASWVEPILTRSPKSPLIPCLPGSPVRPYKEKNYNFYFYYFPVTGCEKYWRTRPGLKPGPPESIVKCITNWAIGHQYLYQSDRHIPKRVLLRLASSFEKLANYI